MESVPAGTPIEHIPLYLSELKATEVFGRYPNDTVIGCDTVVIAGNELLGKPVNKADAYRMISLLSGKEHLVITGVTIINSERKSLFSVKTAVEFKTISKEEAEAYISTAEPYDKAGAYAIQGEAGKFIKEIHGDYYNVVGFPVKRIREELIAFGTEVKPPDLQDSKLS